MSKQIPLKINGFAETRDWSHDSVDPTHKYCGKLEIRSYAL